jgi:hypothetical protein
LLDVIHGLLRVGATALKTSWIASPVGMLMYKSTVARDPGRSSLVFAL